MEDRAVTTQREPRTSLVAVPFLPVGRAGTVQKGGDGQTM